MDGRGLPGGVDNLERIGRGRDARQAVGTQILCATSICLSAFQRGNALDKNSSLFTLLSAPM